LKPLAKIISGGEMSRFMLALKNILADVDEIGTMIFDEIDTGISGHISAVVSEKMCNISRKRQVIAVTHMPSLAAMADNHYLIEKSTENGKTNTHLNLLEDDTNEVARLIGGNDYSVHAIPHAKEMKGWAERYKQSLAK
ncbi:MAG: DNA repair protein RecN, partial [Clostridia bacterium]|nr:DNA repair protein RecN [Clostridia bacterium]